MEPWAAVVTGCIAGLLYLVGSRGLVYLRLDDAVDAVRAKGDGLGIVVAVQICVSC